MSIYHYTDLNGLKGIVSNNSLWATNIYYLNDRLEFRHGLSCYLNALNTHRHEVSSEVRNNIVGFIESIEKIRDLHIYSISFSREVDQLSQWRGYGRDCGVCIEFDEDYLHAAFKNAGYFIQRSDVDYVKSSDHDEIWKIAKSFSPINHLEIAFRDDSKHINSHAHMLMRGLVAFIKHDSFSEEKEYRFVFTPKLDNPVVEFRVSENGFVPYIVLKCEGKEKLPIKSVHIGPVKERDEIQKGIRFLLDYYGYQDVVIENSKIPYRG